MGQVGDRTGERAEENRCANVCIQSGQEKVRAAVCVVAQVRVHEIVNQKHHRCHEEQQGGNDPAAYEKDPAFSAHSTVNNVACAVIQFQIVQFREKNDYRYDHKGIDIP